MWLRENSILFSTKTQGKPGNSWFKICMTPGREGAENFHHMRQSRKLVPQQLIPQKLMPLLIYFSFLKPTMVFFAKNYVRWTCWATIFDLMHWRYTNILCIKPMTCVIKTRKYDRNSYLDRSNVFCKKRLIDPNQIYNRNVQFNCIQKRFHRSKSEFIIGISIRILICGRKSSYFLFVLYKDAITSLSRIRLQLRGYVLQFVIFSFGFRFS